MLENPENVPCNSKNSHVDKDHRYTLTGDLVVNSDNALYKIFCKSPIFS